MKELESLKNKNTNMLNKLVLAIGVLMCFAALIYSNYFKNDTLIDIETILISVGCSMIATSLISMLSSSYISNIQDIKSLINIWQIKNIFETRQQMNERCNLAQANCKNTMDIIALGLKSWRESRESEIKVILSRGVKIRILAPHPNSFVATQRTIDENESPEQVKTTLENLKIWVDSMKTYGQIELKYYNALLQDSYFRIDNVIFIGPYMYGLGSQQTVSYEYHSGGKMFKIYSDKFESLWTNEKFLNCSMLENSNT